MIDFAIRELETNRRRTGDSRGELRRTANCKCGEQRFKRMGLEDSGQDGERVRRRGK